MSDETTGYSEGSGATVTPPVSYDCCGTLIERPSWLPGRMGYEETTGHAAWCLCQDEPNPPKERLHYAYGLNSEGYVWCSRPPCQELARKAMCEAGDG